MIIHLLQEVLDVIWMIVELVALDFDHFFVTITFPLKQKLAKIFSEDKSSVVA